jgi:hypothetical protein
MQVPPSITLYLPPSDPYLFNDPSANRTYYLPFGESGLLNLLPCADGSAASVAAGCAATASSEEVRKKTHGEAMEGGERTC